MSRNDETENPYQTEEFNTKKVGRSSAVKFTKIAVLAAIIFIVFLGLLLPAIQRARPAARRMTCSSNLRQIAAALLSYEKTYKLLPPAFTVDENGKPLHSWRALILPFLDRSDLYKKIDFSKPWNDPMNRPVGKEVVKVFQCLENPLPATSTTYVAVVSDKSCLQRKIGRAISEITDPHSETMLICECNTDQAVHWMEPRDITPGILLDSPSKPKTAHTFGRHAAFMDGAIRFLPTELNRKTLSSMLTIDGNEPEMENDY